MPTAKEVLAEGWKRHQAGDLAGAQRAYEAVKKQVPGNATAWCYLGILHYDLGEMAESEKSYRRAVELQPVFPVAWGNLGNTLSALGRQEEAIAMIERALEQQPGYETAQRNLASALFRAGDFDRAYKAMRTALESSPDDPNLHMHVGILQLLHGDFEQGWDEFEWRFQSDQATLPKCPQPYWDGSDLAGRSILMACEQGLGDTLQFIRFAPLLKRLGAARVMVQCPDALLPLMASFEGADKVVGKKQPVPQTDVFVPMLSIPRVVKMRDYAQFAVETPYVRAEPERVRAWRARLDPDRLTIAVAWQGNPDHKSDFRRSARLSDLAPLAQVPGVQLVSVQRHPSAAVREERLRSAGFELLDFGDALDADGAFLDTAAIMSAADLVVSTDTATAHLAGALDVPAWLALSGSPDWRWFLDRTDSPWYRSMELFRQNEMDDWSTVFGSMADRLRAMVEARGGAPCSSVAIEVSPGELIDKITILEIKREKLTEAAAQDHVRRELNILQAARRRSIIDRPQLLELERALKSVNEALWDIEDDIRRCERAADFGARFVELARNVYRTNDQRSEIKREINTLLGSALAEQKSYEEY